ncbi:hypothetical protein [Agreia sp.]|uniref:hypothetical protein n=1 Tax=Agreia sp. TaxID=1872416 RepID=UPI0035BC0FD3
MSDQQSEFDKKEVDEGEQIIPDIDADDNVATETVKHSYATLEDALPADGVRDHDLH